MTDLNIGLNGVTLFKALKERLRWVNQRQSLLSQNVANADTPEYRAKDLRPMTFQSMLGGANRPTPVAQTDSRHMQGTGARGTYRVEQTRLPYETAPDGNNVVLEEQLVELGKNSLAHKTSTQLYRKHLMMIKTAIGK